jgi:hypothetical protein
MAQSEIARVAYSSKPASNISIMPQSTDSKIDLPSNIIGLIPKRKTILYNHTKVSNFISIHHQVTIKSQFRHMRRQPTLIPAYNHSLCFLVAQNIMINRIKCLEEIKKHQYYEKAPVQVPMNTIRMFNKAVTVL